MDQMVLATQQWLNETYEGKIGWTEIPETGITGWTTVYALLHAFQIENGSTEPSDNIGSWTISKLQEVGILERDDDAEPSNIVKILQGTLWCKGYPADGLSGVFGVETEAGIKELQEDIGLTNPDGKTNLYLWYTLFSMQQFVLLSGGNAKIREFQQRFNRNYKEYYGTYVPCDGLSGRELFTCFILLLQMEEGYSSDEANGNFGPSTTSNCPTLSIGDTDYPETVRCLKMALYLNGFPEGDFDTSATIDQNMINNVHAFNEFMVLPDDSDNITPGTIKSLYISCGDQDRAHAAVDTAYPFTIPSRLGALFNHSIDCVGRYLPNGSTASGENKALTANELANLKSANVRVAPIYQTSGNFYDYFTLEQGITDAYEARRIANGLSLPKDTVIYFAVDYDFLGADIPLMVIPYFEGVNEFFKSSGEYRVGVYGTRNVCNQVSDAGLAVSSYVSDMSYLYSGNMGFPMPKNWSFDQFGNTVYETAGDLLEVDKVAMRQIEHADLGVYTETEEETAYRLMLGDALDSFGLRPLLMNKPIEIGVPVRLATLPIEIEVLVSKEQSTEINSRFTIVSSKNTSGISAELQDKITGIANSVDLDNEGKAHISTSITALIKKFPNGTEFSFDISLEDDGKLCIHFTVNVPKAYEFNGQEYDGSVEVIVKMSPSDLGSNDPFNSSKIEGLNLEEVWAYCTTALKSFANSLTYVIETASQYFQKWLVSISLVELLGYCVMYAVVFALVF